MKKAVSSFIDWSKGFVSESNGMASSKRLVGVACAAFLCWTMYSNHTVEHEPSEALVYSVASLAFASLGLTSAEKIFKKEPKTEENGN
jgi:hypothetical protein